MTEQRPTAPRPPRVLVVDDDARVRAALGAELTAAGCRVEALAPDDLAAGTRRPSETDVALVDVALPAVDTGLALIRRLSATLPVVAFSINGAACAAALAAGAAAYLEKDGDTDRLLRTLHALIRPDSRSPR